MKVDKSKWEKKKLGEVCSFKNGFAFKSQLFKNKGLPIIRISNIGKDGTLCGEMVYFDSTDYKDLSSFQVRPKDLLIAMSGATTGKIAINNSDETFYLNQRVGRINAKKELKQTFLYYYLRIKSTSFLHQAKGVAQPNLSGTQIMDFIIQVPSLDEQYVIATELDTLQSLITQYREQLNDYDKLAQSIFHEMFGDVVKNDKMWPTVQFKDLANSINYGTSSPANEGGKYKYLRMGNITDNGYLNLDDLKYIDISDSDIEKYIVRKGDILFNRTNSREKVGKTTCFMEEEEMIIAGYIIRVRLDESKVVPIFIARGFNTPAMKRHLIRMARGSVGQANINSKELGNISIILPPLPLQQQFASRIESIEAQKALIKQQLADAQTLFDSRMQYYFN